MPKAISTIQVKSKKERKKHIVYAPEKATHPDAIAKIKRENKNCGNKQKKKYKMQNCTNNLFESFRMRIHFNW